MSDPTCFPILDSFFKELQAAFQPPKCEFRLRTRFLNIRQGQRDLHSYVQEARYLVASLTTEPLGEQLKLTVFLNGLASGPVRQQLYRLNVTTMEEAIAKGLEEDFSIKAAVRSEGRSQPAPRQQKQQTFSPMEVFMAQGNTFKGKKVFKRNFGKSFDKSKAQCRRCQKLGHFAGECRAPAPVPPKREAWATANTSSVQGAKQQSNGKAQ
jgi:hypothetical protein